MMAGDHVEDVFGRLIFRVGEAAALLAPPALVRHIARVALNRDRAGIGVLRTNLTKVMGRPATATEPSEAVGSYARYWQEMISSLSPRRARQQVDRVRAVGEWHAAVREIEQSHGVIIVLPHMGNWDLAARWAIEQGFDIMTVAERVSPRWLFRTFLRARTGAGLRVLAHDNVGKAATLAQHLLSGGVVAVVCDRHMGSRSGLSQIAGNDVQLPTGVLQLARHSGCPVFPVALIYDNGLVVDVGPRFRVDEATAEEEALRLLGEGLTWAIARSPLDWHMLQPVFDDLTPRRRATTNRT